MFTLTSFIVVAELDEKWELTGNATEVLIQDENKTYERYSTFGTMRAFDKAFSAQEKMKE